jgi:putative membrane protein
MDAMHPRTYSLLALLLIALTAVSCGSMNTMTMPGKMAANDIAGIVTTANEGEIQQGQAALTAASSADVREFAQMMVTDHTNALNAAKDAFTRNGITPADNDTTRNLKDSGQRTMTNLSSYRGAAFDRAYMQSQIDMHQWLLTNMDSVLIPSARGDVRTLLETQRGAVASHLEHARQVMGRL